MVSSKSHYWRFLSIAGSRSEVLMLRRPFMLPIVPQYIHNNDLGSSFKTVVVVVGMVFSRLPNGTSADPGRDRFEGDQQEERLGRGVPEGVPQLIPPLGSQERPHHLRRRFPGKTSYPEPEIPCVSKI